jgi:AcrR family transcriptional regulator
VSDKTATRASPMPIEDRQDLIIDAVIPLLMERGHAVTTRQIADAAGIAEGTIFRAFGDKETLIRAAVARHLDPAPLRRQLAAIDPALPLESKVRQVIQLLQARFTGVFRLMAAINESDRPSRPPRAERTEYAAIVAATLQPDLDRLAWPPESVAPLIRLIAFSSSMPMMNDDTPFTLDELTRFVLYGIAGRAPGAAGSDPVAP